MSDKDCNCTDWGEVTFWTGVTIVLVVNIIWG